MHIALTGYRASGLNLRKGDSPRSTRSRLRVSHGIHKFPRVVFVYLNGPQFHLNHVVLVAFAWLLPRTVLSVSLCVIVYNLTQPLTQIVNHIRCTPGGL